MRLPFREEIKAMLPAAGRETLNRLRTLRRRQIHLHSLQREYHASNATGKYITYLVMQGMTNRIKAHIIAAHTARMLDRTLVPVWHRTPECNANFQDLFSTKIQKWQFSSKRVVHYDVKRDTPSTELETLHTAVEDLIVLDLNWQYIYMENLLRRIGGVNNFAMLFADTLPVREEIVGRVEKTLKNWGRPMIGVQLRRGDFVSFRMALSVETYIEATEAVLVQYPSAGIYLASDASREEIKPFLDHFGRRVHFTESKGRTETDGIRDALYDLLLLSHCIYLVLTPISGFGHMAAQIGAVPHRWVNDRGFVANA